MNITPSPLRHYKTVEEYQAFAKRFMAFEDEAEKLRMNRLLCRTDLFWLIWYACGKSYIGKQWILERCKEVEASPDGHLDLWSREHFKSSLITYGKSIQDILASHGDDPLPEWDREVTIGILSVTRPLAKGFLREIKETFESNELLKSLFPDILYQKPQVESTKWALDINTPILTSEGWKNHGELEIGDKIYGSKGQLINVIGKSEIMQSKECYRIIFDDCEIIADADHLWPVECRNGTSGAWLGRSAIKILKTSQLKAKTKLMRLLPTPSIDIKHNNKLLIDPYILGLWLGDGTAGTNIISMHNNDKEECINQFRKANYEFYIHREKEKDNFSMYCLKGLKEQLEELGCLRNKFIPTQYLYGTKEERLALLQGLMDSDGTCKKICKSHSQGMCTFSNTNVELADGVFFLATSLGMRPSRIQFIPKSRGRKIVHHIYFIGTKLNPPFRSERKLANCREERTRKHRYIKSIERIDTVPVNCIKVDAPDSLYLAGRSLVVTHNSEDVGICVKRKNVVKEQTVEAWGLVDGQPTGKHFYLIVYDDVVTQDSVTNPEMIQKTTQAFGLSDNIGTRGGKYRVVGTPYHANDTLAHIIEKGSYKLRKHPGTFGGKWPIDNDSEAPLLTKKQLEEKYIKQGSYVFSCQILLSPTATSLQNFKYEWLKFFGAFNSDYSLNANFYILVDPANSKKDSADYTVMTVIACCSDDNYYIVDMVRDRLNLSERTDKLFYLHRKWKPIAVGYEQYGAQSDIEHIEEKQSQLNYHFNIIKLGGGSWGRLRKEDRIAKLQPIFQARRFLLPYRLNYIDYEGNGVDLVNTFIKEEYLCFPVSKHDDMLDTLASILNPDMNAFFPETTEYEQNFAEKPNYASLSRNKVTGY